MSITVGSIRGRESKEVLRDVLKARRVPKGLYSFTGRELHLLVGTREVKFAVPAGLSFYSLKSLCEKLDRAVDELEAAKRQRSQLDLEDAIASAP